MHIVVAVPPASPRSGSSSLLVEVGDSSLVTAGEGGGDFGFSFVTSGEGGGDSGSSMGTSGDGEAG